MVSSGDGETMAKSLATQLWCLALLLLPTAGGVAVREARARASRHATHHRRHKLRSHHQATSRGARADYAKPPTPWGPKYSALQPLPPSHLLKALTGNEGTVHRCHFEGYADHLEDYLTATQLVDPDE